MMRLGIIGYGKMGRLHRQVFEAQGCEVVASVNRSEQGRAVAAEEGIPETFADVDAMLDAAQPDAVICCAGFTDIASVSQGLAASGLPQLIEKPPGLFLIDYEMLSDRMEGIPHCVGLNRRHYSEIEKAVAALGGVEALTALRLEWSEAPQAFLDRGYAPEAVHRLAMANSLHGLDLLSWLGGACAAPSYDGRTLGAPFRRQMTLETTGQWGAAISFRSTWDAPAGWRLVMEAEQAQVVCAPMEQAVLYRAGEPQQALEPDVEDQHFKAGLYRQARHFLDVCEQGLTTHPHNLASCRQGMEWADTLTGIFPVQKEWGNTL